MRPTKEGKRFIFVTALIGLAAFNTGNNLIYILLGMMLSIHALSYIALAVNLHGIELSAKVRRHVFAEEQCTVEILASNTKRFIPSYSLNISLSSPVEGRAAIARIGSGESSSCDLELTFPHRGLYTYGQFILDSGFPFIFYTKKVRVKTQGSVTVYPKVIAVGGLAMNKAEGEDIAHRQKGEGEDLYSLREFSYGDDIRRVSWKTSAKLDKLILREFADETPETVTIVLDDIQPLDNQAFERAVSLCAGLATRFSGEGYPVGLLTCHHYVQPGIGKDHLYRIMELLAVIAETDTWECLLVGDNVQGNRVAVIKSGESSLRDFAASCEMVVNASSI